MADQRPTRRFLPLRVKIMKRVREVARRIIRPILIAEPATPAKYIPYDEEASSFLQGKPPQRDPDADLAIPPTDLWVACGPGGYGDSPAAYLENGRKQVDVILGALSAADAPLARGNRVLEFGCASGRLIRWFAEHAEDSEVWGVDISAPHIVWCQAHLAPPFHFCTTTTIPHLPFEDSFFSVIFAGSVFTHIDELADAWFLELRRCLTPGGHLYVTINDKHSLGIIRDNPSFNLHKRVANSGLPLYREDFSVATIDRSYTLYDMDYLRQKLQRLFEVVSVTQEAYGFQTGVLLRKR